MKIDRTNGWDGQRSSAWGGMACTLHAIGEGGAVSALRTLEGEDNHEVRDTVLERTD